MSNQIPVARVQQYSASVYHLVQQKGSKLAGHVRRETITGKSAFFDQLGKSVARLKTTRHAPTPTSDTPHLRRRVTTKTWDVADHVDLDDLIRILQNPASMYAESQAMELGRRLDSIILEAVDATAYTGEDGSTSTSFDSGMIVDVQTVWPGVSAADTGLNMAKLIEARKLLGANDVDPDEEVIVVANMRQISSLLKDERFINKDYNNVAPLMEGKAVRAAGCTIVPCNRITTDGNGDDKVPFWTKAGMLFASGHEASTKISERNDLSHAMQIYSWMDGGATRMEETRVGYIECDPGASPTTDV